MKDFLKTSDHQRAVLDQLVDQAINIKNERPADKPLDGQSVALVFFNPSLRTRASMQVGIYELGGNAVILEPGGTSWTLEHRDGVVMDGNKTEHLAEFVRVLERYVPPIGARPSPEPRAGKRNARIRSFRLLESTRAYPSSTSNRQCIIRVRRWPI